MALWVLGNAVNFHGTTLRPGKVIDDRLYNLTQLRGARAILYAANATSLAQAALLRGDILQGHELLSPDGGSDDQVGIPVAIAGGGGGGGGGGGTATPVRVTGSLTLSAANPLVYPSGAIVLLMPPSPLADGTPISFVDITETWGATNVSVQSSAGQTIEDPAVPGTFRAAGVSVLLTQNGGTVAWQFDLTNLRWKLV